MTKAIWKGAVLAESEATIVVEGNHYFPPETVKREHVRPSDAVNADAAWYYPETKDAAKAIKGYVAFWHGVTVDP